MTKKDRIKIAKAGFVIIRADEHNLAIKKMASGGHAWSVLEKGFASKAALRRRMNELLKMQLIVED